MPPLCTVGYGIATNHWYYSLGALYLFFINSVFICIATVIVLRFMRLSRHKYESEKNRKRMTLYILILVILTIAPSIWLAYRIVQKAVFQNTAERFLDKEFVFPNTLVVNRSFIFDQLHPSIDVLLIGELLDSSQIGSLKDRLSDYHLDSTRLIIRQGFNARNKIDFAQIKAGILDEVLKSSDTNTRTLPIPTPATPSFATPDLHQEIQTLFPALKAYTLDKVPVHTIESEIRSAHDSLLIFSADTKADSSMPEKERERMRRWLRIRLSPDSVLIFFRNK